MVAPRVVAPPAPAAGPATTAAALSTLAAEVERSTAGGLRIVPAAPPATAGQTSEASRAVRAGKAAMALLRIRDEADRAALYAFDLIPGLLAPAAAGDDRPARLATAARDLIARRLAEDGLVLLAWAPLATEVLAVARPLPLPDARTDWHLALPPRPDAALRRLADLLRPAPNAAAPPAATLAVMPQGAGRDPAGNVLEIPLRQQRLALVAARQPFDALPAAHRDALSAAARLFEQAIESASVTKTPPQPKWLSDAARQLLREWAIGAGADGRLLLELYERPL